jgi:hypothetical protein
MENTLLLDLNSFTEKGNSKYTHHFYLILPPCFPGFLGKGKGKEGILN